MKVEQHVEATPATVWAIITDLDRYADVADIVALERLDDGAGFGVGTKWRETRRMFGREATEDMWVTEIDAGRKYVVEAESHGAHYRSVLEVSPEANGSRLSMQFDGVGTNVVTKVLGNTVGRLFEGPNRKAMQADLAAIAAAAEADGAAAADVADVADVAADHPDQS